MFDKNGMCVCGHCNHSFKFSERKQKIVNVYGHKVSVNVCPACGAEGYTHDSHRRWLEYKYDQLNFA